MTTPDVAATLTLRPETPQWLVDHYALVDAADLDTYSKDFDDEIVVTFGALPPVHGKEAAIAALGAGHAQYSMRHTFRNVWDAHGHVLIQFEVQFTFPDGRTETVPTVAMIRHRSHVLTSLQVFIDRAPLVPTGV